jgi:hypothetical protein
LRARALTFLVVLAVTASVGVRERRVEKALAGVTSADVIDMGIDLHVVRQSPDGKKVRTPTPANTVRVVRLGGMVQIGGAPDGWNADEQGDPPRAFYVGPSEKPVRWMCSEAQERLIMHGPDDPMWALIQGSEGAGKSVALVMWTAVRVLEHVGRSVTGAITVPTVPRFRAVRKEIAKVWPARWYRWKERDHAYAFHAGPSVQIVSAVQRSEAGGSPLQGDSLEWCASDELQDHFTLEADIMSRGRGSDRYLRLCTSTSKDYSEWRDFRATVQGSPMWTFARMIGMESPFVDAEFWQNIRRSGTVTEREWRRRYLAEDVGPEKQVYFSWLRSFPSNGAAANLRPIPAGARDVTADVMKPWGPNITALVGHDPGQRQHVSVILKAYRFEGQRDEWPRWFAVDEITTPESTIHAHATLVLERLRTKWRCEPPPDRQGRIDPTAARALVRIDPATVSGDEHPGDNVYAMWRSLGMMARAAAYKPGGSTPITIKRTERIDMVNTLLAATAPAGEIRRLFVALGPDGKIAAPMLVKAFETMETNAAGKAERDRKDADDLSHWPAALGYALWSVEARRLGLTLDQAVAS